MASPDAVIGELEQRVARAAQTLELLIGRVEELQQERDTLRAELLEARRKRRRLAGLEEDLQRLRQQNAQLRDVRAQALQRTRNIVRKLGILKEDLGLRAHRSDNEPVSEAQG